MITHPWLNFIVALGIGLLIGLDRERTKGEGPGRRAAGIRTFTLATLAGAVGMHVGGKALLAVVTVAVAALALLSHLRHQTQDPGLTTEIGLVATPLLGGLAMTDPLLAAGVGAAMAGVFAAKAPLHRFVNSVLTEGEVRDALIFAVATLVVWPLLPDRYMGPLQALNPHSIWLLVVLLLALAAGGHIATRMLGAGAGLPVAGLASGFISSTATIGAMAGRAAKQPACLPSAVAGSTFSVVATFVQMAVLLLTASPPIFMLMAPALAAGGLTVLLYGLFYAVRGAKAIDGTPTAAGRSFGLGTALGLAAVMAVMLVAAAYLRVHLGEGGIVVGAALGGIFDAHSTAISVASLTASAGLPPREAVLPILIGMTTNAAAKVVAAAGVGSARFAVRVIPGLVLSMAAAWALSLPILLG